MTYRNRHECKFLVSESQAQAVLGRAMPFVGPDPFGARRPDHAYAISSLYLDDARLSLYHETRAGEPFRAKLRVRAYDDEPDHPVFVEIKRRHDRVVQKMRCPIPRAVLPAVLAGDLVELPGASAERIAALREFQRLVLLRRASPNSLVRYMRQAYVGKGDPELRVTVDRRLCVLPTRSAEVRVAAPGFVPVATQGVVLELKFTDRMPPWMAETIRVCELRRQSFSKYCTSLDALARHGLADPGLVAS